MSGIVSVLVVAAWCLGIGELLLRRLSGDAHSRPADQRWLERFVAGMLALYLLLTALDLVGLGWGRAVLAAAGGSVFGALLLVAPASSSATASAPRLRRWRWHLGDGLALLAISGFAAAAYSLRSPFSDFVYHWGLKAHRFFLYGGVDFAFLARAENGYLHPDYPNLFPSLLAATASVAGRFDERALMLWSPLFLAALWLGLRAAARLLLRHEALAATLAGGLTLAASGFSIGYFQAGSADLPFAVAVLVGSLGLIERTPGHSARLVALAAALAACTKIEGIPFAFLVLALFGARSARASGLTRRELGTLLAQAGAPLLLTLPWWISLWRFGLLQPTNTGGLDLSRLQPIAAASREVLGLAPWHGFAWLLLLAPLLLARRSTRWAAALCFGQVVFYLFVYASAPLEPAPFVRSNLPRLLFHVAPVLWVGLFAPARYGDET